MKLTDAINVLNRLDAKFGRYVFSKKDLRTMFPEEDPRALDKSIERLVSGNILERVYKGVFLYSQARTKGAYIIEDIAKCIRLGKSNYVSLESMLSEYGVISQIPVSRITVMTTGREGVCKTPYGTIEFTHTRKNRSTILDGTLSVPGRPLRIATKEMALSDLKRVNRNCHLIQKEEITPTNKVSL